LRWIGSIYDARHPWSAGDEGVEVVSTRPLVQLRAVVFDQLEFSGDVDAATDAARDGAPCRVGAVGPLDRRSVGVW
jgi:hypothetical protein